MTLLESETGQRDFINQRKRNQFGFLKNKEMYYKTKRMEKKLDGNYTRMPQAILNKTKRQHPTKQHLYGHQPPIKKLSKLHEPDTNQTRGTLLEKKGGARGWCTPVDPFTWTRKSSSVPIRDVVLRIYRKQWTIGRCERGSGISVLIARDDDDDDDYKYVTA